MIEPVFYGKWINMDFSNINFFVIFDWDSIEDEATYIMHEASNTEIVNDTDISKPSDESIIEALSNGVALD